MTEDRKPSWMGAPQRLGSNTPGVERHRKHPPPYGGFASQSLQSPASHKAVYLSPPFSIKDKSNPEDQSSWDSFKNMTPELSIVPGEQKDRMELHNKNWDSSSANTPDSSEGDFQTEVWGRTDVQPLTNTRALTPRHTAMRNSSTAIHKWISAKVSHTPVPVSTDVFRRIRYCICLPPQRADTAKGDCSTIYFRKKTIEK